MSEGVKMGAEHLRPHVYLPRNPEYVMLSMEEVEALDRTKPNRSVELFWGACGLFLGTIGPAITAISVLARGGVMDFGALAAVVGCAVSFVLAAVMGWFGFRRPSPAEELMREIRERPRVPLGVIAALDYPSTPR